MLLRFEKNRKSMLCLKRRIVCSIIYKYSPYHLFIVKLFFSITGTKVRISERKNKYNLLNP